MGREWQKFMKSNDGNNSESAWVAGSAVQRVQKVRAKVSVDQVQGAARAASSVATRGLSHEKCFA